MINNIKMGIKLIKYGFNIKQQLFSAILILVVGLVVEIATMGKNILGGFYIVLVSMFVHQAIQSLDISALVQSSKLKKSLQTTIPTSVSFFVYLFMTGFLVAIKAVIIYLRPETKGDVIASMIMVAYMCFFVLVYNGLAYKFFAISMVVLMLTIMPISFMSTGSIAFGFDIYELLGDKLTFGMAAGIWFIAIVLGTLAEYGLSALFYKHELSKTTFKSWLKQMQ